MWFHEKSRRATYFFLGQYVPSKYVFPSFYVIYSQSQEGKRSGKCVLERFGLAIYILSPCVGPSEVPMEWLTAAPDVAGAEQQHIVRIGGSQDAGREWKLNVYLQHFTYINWSEPKFRIQISTFRPQGSVGHSLLRASPNLPLLLEMANKEKEIPLSHTELPITIFFGTDVARKITHDRTETKTRKISLKENIGHANTWTPSPNTVAPIMCGPYLKLSANLTRTEE